ncbi:hypothetical protein LCGC14_2159810, partial [marine sediment metagenome]
MLNLYKDAVTILLYHGVTKHKSHNIENVSRKHLDIKTFTNHMRFVKQNANVISMSDIINMSDAEKISGRHVAITFDDGFENNYSVAAPILDKLGVPATFYISAGIINTDLMFWVDELEDCINTTTEKNIAVNLGGFKRSFDISSNKKKLEALNTIKSHCKKCSSEEKNWIVLQVQEETNVIGLTGRSPNYRKLNWEQVRKLHSHSLFTIGGHGLYHDVLSKLKPSALRK